MTDWPSPAEIERLHLALAAMPEPRRSVYRLSARDGLQYGEIAARLGIDIAQVKRNLAEALAELVAALDGDGDIPPSPR